MSLSVPEMFLKETATRTAALSPWWADAWTSLYKQVPVSNSLKYAVIAMPSDLPNGSFAWPGDSSWEDQDLSFL